ncbi:hypothetical protein CEUSTIGMA_g12898.t1 [Chlamydomonas eustigma]|uniref:Uncharacterized protein n=1 Tax=Chlamydomonas eustigma TaxID=1157962 RepID=A0A250XRB4_9CHLO|nr:hypothetical protein CEUSTIGMA_g12898.t1 [Chlamydomonas eustigma]|eukprot:GAX85482.1 hypothetical protein CEUSTIGMA_g12898.t1 [Chlamydomonas eustigma]
MLYNKFANIEIPPLSERQSTNSFTDGPYILRKAHLWRQWPQVSKVARHTSPAVFAPLLTFSEDPEGHSERHPKVCLFECSAYADTICDNLSRSTDRGSSITAG